MARDEELKVRITGRNETGGAFNAAAAEAEGFAKKIERGPLGALSRLSGAFAGIVGVSIFIDQMKKTIAAAIESEETIVHLATAIESTGQTAEKVAPRLEGFISAVDRASRFDDEGIRRGLTTLIQMGGEAAQSEQLLAATADLAVARHLSFEDAAERVGKALAGQATMLQRSGVFMSDATKKVIELGTESERASVLITVLGTKFGDASQKDLDSYAGRLAEVKNELGNIREEIGGDFLGVLDKGILKFDEFGRSAAAAVTVFKESGFFAAMHELATGELYQFGKKKDKEAKAPTGDKEKGVLTPAQLKALEDEVALREKNKKALEAEAKAAAKYLEELDKALNRGPEWERTLRLLADKVAEVDKRLGEGHGAQAFADDLEGLYQAAKKTGSAFDQLRSLPGLGEGANTFGKVVAAMPELDATYWAERKRREEDLAKFIEDFHDDRSELRRAEDAAAVKRLSSPFEKDLSRIFGASLTDMFADLASTGGKNFGDIAANAMLDGIQAGAGELSKLFVDVLGSAFGGGDIQQTAGGFMYGGQTFTTQEGAQQAKTARGQEVFGAIGQGFGGLAGLAGAVGNPNPQNDLDTVLSATLSGASLGGAVGSIVPVIGTAIGAVVGAIVGVIVGAFAAISSDVGEQYKYGIPTVRGGEFNLVPGQNIREEERRTINAQGQSVIDETVGGFAEIFRELGQVLPNVFRDFRWDDAIQGAASANFMKHLNQFFSGTLPRALAEEFRTPLQQAFETVGLSAGAFVQIWNELDDLDPKKAVELWKALAQGLGAMEEAYERFGPRYERDTDPMRRDELIPGGGYMGIRAYVQAETDAPWVDQLRDFDAEMFVMAQSLEALPLAEQIEVLAELGRMSEERYQMELAYIQQINDMVEESDRDIDARHRGYEMAGIEDPAGKVTYLEDYLAGLQDELEGATNLQDAARLRAEILSVIDQIYDLSSGIEGMDMPDLNQWAIDALEITRTLFNNKMAEFGDAIDEANQDWTNSVRPLVDRWIQDLEDAGTATTNIRGGFNDLDRDTRRLSATFVAAADAMAAAASKFSGPDPDGEFVTKTVDGR